MNDSLLEFPCDFPIKVMGVDTPVFRTLVDEIVKRHAGPSESTTRPSRDGKYLAVSYTLRARSQAQLDALYEELSAADEVLFLL